MTDKFVWKDPKDICKGAGRFGTADSRCRIFRSGGLLFR